MTIRSDKTSGLLNVSGTLDIEGANTLRETLLKLLVSQPEAAADLSEVESCDTAALQVLLAGQKAAQSSGTAFPVTTLSTSIIEIAEALGFSPDALVCSERAASDAV